MRLLTLTLALIIFLCTCGRAQNVRSEPLKFEQASIAFIKSPGSLRIDSIAINTSIDKTPYGFAFPQDTMLLEIEVLLPVDELTIETFTQGQSHGRSTCWVDPPSADVYLSVTNGVGRIDSVGLSQVNRWYQEKVQEILSLKSLELRKYELGQTISVGAEDLIVLRFIEAYLNMPNLTSSDIYYLWDAVKARFAPIRRHPDFLPLWEHARLLATHKRAQFKRLEFLDAQGRKRRLPDPPSDYFLLEIYQRSDSTSLDNHLVLRESPVVDSLLQEVPMVSLTSEESHALWSLYVKDGNFKWLHGLHVPNARVPTLADWGIFPGSTYLLVDKRFNLIGAYPDLRGMAAGVWWHTGGEK